MISPRLARRIAQIHKWLGLIVGAQLLIWTVSGLFFASFALSDVKGEGLVHPASHRRAVDMSRVKISSTEALQAVAENIPDQVLLHSVGGQPVYEIRALIGVFLVSAETGRVISPIDEAMARAVAGEVWAGGGELQRMELIEKAPREAGLPGAVWAAHYSGEGNRILYISAVTGDVGGARTDLWRTYDFLYSLHIMDYQDRENWHSPWMMAAAFLGLSTVLFGIFLLIHRFTRGVLKPKPETP